jgi:hypothetical protein
MLASTVHTAMAASDAHMLKYVLPAMLPKIGGGEITPIETIDHDFAKAIDTDCGGDLWQRMEDGGHRLIASRVQWGPTNWATTTIRYAKASGYDTEYHKLCRAVHGDDGRIYPAITIHAYIAGTRADPKHLIAAAAVRTKDLLEYVDHPDTVSQVNRADNTTFKCVPWRLFEDAGQWLQIVPDAQTHQTDVYADPDEAPF